MSHNVEYFTYPENINREYVKKNLDNYVAHADWQEGCSGLNGNIRWIEGQIMKNDEEAHKFIESHDRGNYDQLAVRYYQSIIVNDDKTRQLEDKRNEAYKEYQRREQKCYPQTLSSSFVGCKNCCSRLSVKHLNGNICPVCKSDMRPEYMLKSIETAKKKWEKSRQAVLDYIDKHSKKEVVWLVKIEYHT